MAHDVQRRAAFDIGSGATKLYIADVRPVAGTIAEVLFAEEMPVGFSLAWKRSPDGCLDDAIQTQGLQVLHRFVAECEKHKVQGRCAVATEVFRKAKNGENFLARVRDELGLQIRLISQDEEARIGFLTAAAFRGDASLADIVCWDSGGASFQITTPGPAEALLSYMGPLGTGVAAALCAEAQGRTLAQAETLNPVTLAVAEELIRRIQAKLTEPPEWLHRRSVVAIGGPNSMFRICAEHLREQTFDLEAARRALREVVGRSDEDLATEFCHWANPEPASLVCPKLALLVGVMEHCRVAEVRFQPATGSCAGMVVCEELYAERAPGPAAA